VTAVFVIRAHAIKAIRDFYDDRGYLEVETPVLQAVAGGAAARPFLTYHNALEHQFHLRISLELYLKRLIVGGLERVYEIGRVFRNEGLSTRHNPEFTLLESYEAYANLEDIEKLVEELFCTVCNKVYGSSKAMYQGHELDFTPPWPRLPMLEGIEKYSGVKPEEFETLESAKAAMERLGLPTENEDMIGGIIEKIHERFVQPNLIQPTFITDFPIETSPLAKKIPGSPHLTRRFEVYIGAQETGNAFSEINDPMDQRDRFIQQGSRRAAGDVEAHPMDEDYIRALEYGMPPTGGLGIGIDRLVMLFTDQDSIRDVVLFPQMKPE
jgi:lysyl-tRNA synthetase class 2